MAAVRSTFGESGAVERTRRRSARGVWWAVGALLIEAFVAMPGCLNPRPEELPSATSDPVVPDANRSSLPERETCSDNPLLVGCQAVPDTDINNDPISNGEGAADNAEPSFSITATEPAQGDAGAPPSDAGASADSGATEP